MRIRKYACNLLKCLFLLLPHLTHWYTICQESWKHFRLDGILCAFDIIYLINLPITLMLGSSWDCQSFESKYNTTKITMVTRHTSGDGVKLSSTIFVRIYFIVNGLWIIIGDFLSLWNVMFDEIFWSLFWQLTSEMKLQIWDRAVVICICKEIFSFLAVP